MEDKLEEALIQYDRIILLDKTVTLRRDQICQYLDTLGGKRNILLLGTEEFICNANNCRYYQITDEEEKGLQKLYFTYEFSDRLIVLSKSLMYGDIWNYVETGIMTEEEAFRALFH